MSLSERKPTVIKLWREWREHVRDRNEGLFPHYDTGAQIHLFYERKQGNSAALTGHAKRKPIPRDQGMGC